MKADVYFIPMACSEKLNLIHTKIHSLYQKANLHSCIEKNDLVAIKIHFGERGNVTHVPAKYLIPVIKNIQKAGGKPFFTDTNVLYKSSRSDAVSHIKLAGEHGFSVNKCGAPVIITDGLRGSGEIDVKINGKIFNSVSIASEAVYSNALIAVTHVTGHMGTGIGGTLKNLGMGLASRKGKLRQHSSVKPWIDKIKCTACGQCIKWCPENAIEMIDETAFIKTEMCIGCGECLTVCRYDAVKYNWKTSNVDLQKKIAEHALGAVANKDGKVAYLNFLINITKDCDCLGTVQKPILPDIGILASTDPVAIDKASLDLIEKQTNGKSLMEITYPNLDGTVQLFHAQEIGLGTMDYKLIEINV